MPRCLRIISVGLLSIGLWGCGGSEKPADNKADNKAAGNNAAGGGGGGAAGGGMQMGGGQQAAATAPKAAAASTSAAQDLLQYIPEDLKLAAGASIATLSDSATPFSKQLLAQFQPILMLLERAGI